MNNNPIGIFDSGVGGLTVFSKLIKKVPDENYIYFGDTKNLPYGSKSQNELITIAKDIFDFFKSRKVKAVVMACNTTSALTYEELKNNYDFTIYPIIQIAAKCIAELDANKIGILSTEATAKSHAYSKEIQKHNKNIQVFEKACPGWVQIVENKTQNDPESIELVKTFYEDLYAHQTEKIILGCTHYPYLKDILKTFNNEEMFIDPSNYFVDYICNDLAEKSLLAEKQLFEPEFIVSAEAEKFKKSAELFYKIEKTPQTIIPSTIG